MASIHECSSVGLQITNPFRFDIAKSVYRWSDISYKWRLTHLCMSLLSLPQWMQQWLHRRRQITIFEKGDDAHISNNHMLDPMQFLLKSLSVVIPSALEPFGLRLFIATVTNGRYVWWWTTHANFGAAGYNVDAVIVIRMVLFGDVPKTASASDKVEAIILNDQAAERYSRIRFYMQLYSLGRAAVGRMSSGAVV